MLHSTTVAAAGLSLCAAVAGAQTFLVNFDTDAAGNPLVAGTGFTGLEYAAFGVVISAAGPNPGPLNLFNSDARPATGGDPDLRTGPEFGTDAQGNVLIFQDLGTPLNNPDDDEQGAIFTFDFSATPGVSTISIGILDLEEDSVPSFTASTLGGVTFSAAPTGVLLVNPGFPGDNSLRVFTFVFDEFVSSFSADILGASGAITFVEFQVVPAPASLAMLGLGAVAAGRRRR